MLESREEELKRIKNKMRKAIKGAKRSWLSDRINDALEDPSGALIWKLAKEIIPKISKQQKDWIPLKAR